MTISGQIIRWIADGAGALAGVGCLYLLAAGAAVLRYRGAGDRPPAAFERAATILVPLCGDEPGLAERLVRLRNLDHAAPVQVICGGRDADDPAIGRVEEANAAAGLRPIELRVDPRLHGRNLKISNLINMFADARHDAIVMIDSDIEVGPHYVADVLQELLPPDVGAVTCLYHGVAAEPGLPSRLAAAGINLHFLPDVVFGLALGIARPCLGATIAISREDLARIGGLEACADQLWDDHAIGRLVRTSGRRVAVGTFAPAHVCSEKSMRTLLSRQLRAARTIRGINPAGQAGAVITHPFPLALLALLLSWTWWAAALCLIAAACRAMLERCVHWRFGAPATPPALIPLADLLAAAIYVASFLSATVEWRGQRYRVNANGDLTPVAN
ncbi:MAG: bacteriohopanetetrol glucosamine biosynthesis glycosyltransferase HpnI [Pararhizobium sp.]